MVLAPSKFSMRIVQSNERKKIVDVFNISIEYSVLPFCLFCCQYHRWRFHVDLNSSWTHRRPIHSQGDTGTRFRSPCFVQFDKAAPPPAKRNNSEREFKNRILNSKIEPQFKRASLRFIGLSLDWLCESFFFKSDVASSYCRFICVNIFWFGRGESAKLFVGTGSFRIFAGNRYIQDVLVIAMNALLGALVCVTGVSAL